MEGILLLLARMVTLNITTENSARLAATYVKAGGGVICPKYPAEQLEAWRAEVKQLCKAAGVPVRTGLTNRGDKAWAVHRNAELVIAARLGVSTDFFCRVYGDSISDEGSCLEPDSEEGQRALNDALEKLIA